MKRILASALILCSSLTATAQQAPASAGKHDWSRVQSLPIGTTVLLNSSTRHGSCKLKSVDADSLTCTSGGNTVIARADIKSVKLARRLLSAAAGVAIGATAGFIAGFVAAGPNGGPNSFLPSITRADVGGIFAVGAGFLGGLIGFFTHFASVTVYHS
jgi:hypothetical protein